MQSSWCFLSSLAIMMFLIRHTRVSPPHTQVVIRPKHKESQSSKASPSSMIFHRRCWLLFGTTRTRKWRISYHLSTTAKKNHESIPSSGLSSVSLLLLWGSFYTRQVWKKEGWKQGLPIKVREISLQHVQQERRKNRGHVVRQNRWKSLNFHIQSSGSLPFRSFKLGLQFPSQSCHWKTGGFKRCCWHEGWSFKRSHEFVPFITKKKNDMMIWYFGPVRVGRQVWITPSRVHVRSR